MKPAGLPGYICTKKKITKDLFYVPRGKMPNLLSLPNGFCPQCLTATGSGPDYFLSFSKSLLAHAKTVLENMVEKENPDWAIMSLSQSVNVGIATVAPGLANSLLIEVVLFVCSFHLRIPRKDKPSVGQPCSFFSEDCGTVKDLLGFDIRDRTDLAFPLTQASELQTCDNLVV